MEKQVAERKTKADEEAKMKELEEKMKVVTEVDENGEQVVVVEEETDHVEA